MRVSGAVPDRRPDLDEKVLAALKAVDDDPRHAWRKGLSPEERKKIDEFYKERYEK